MTNDQELKSEKLTELKEIKVVKELEECVQDSPSLSYKVFFIKNDNLREMLCEALCTFVLLSFGLGANAEHMLGKNSGFDLLFAVHVAWGLAVLMGILVGGKISGAHMNPCVTVVMVVLGKLRPLKLAFYTIGQAIGAFLASILVYIVYLDALNAYDGGTRNFANGTAGIWATYPSDHLSTFGGLIDQICGTAFLILMVLTISEKKLGDMPLYLAALFNGTVIVVIGLSFGLNCGYAVNPVRDFVPRCFTASFGWGMKVFSANNYFFWIPLIGPFIGALLGALIYTVLIGSNLKEKSIIHEKKSMS